MLSIYSLQWCYFYTCSFGLW